MASKLFENMASLTDAMASNSKQTCRQTGLNSVDFSYGAMTSVFEQVKYSSLESE